MRLHFVGIGGTGMGAVAGLLKAAGHEVRGSDVALYPPMSEQLAELGVPVFTGYSATNLDWSPDAVVMGNVHSKDHVEAVAAATRGIPLTSFPALLGEHFLASRHSIVVAGTHGKTTTTSLLAHLLQDAGRDPGLFVGGVPLARGRGWHLGKGADFVVEGDEYDTAFFDKGSKFFHYHPQTVILTSVELDHVDIFPSFDAVKAAFVAFVQKIPTDGVLFPCADDKGAMEVASHARCRLEPYSVVDVGSEVPEGIVWSAHRLETLRSGRVAFDVQRGTERIGRFETLLSGRHNVGNCLAALAAAMSRGVAVPELVDGMSSFAGVRRRQELRGIAGGVTVIDDYGHHPTAVRETLRAMRRRFAGRRLFAIYDPRSATSRRRTFQANYVEALGEADEVVIGKLYDPTKISAEERFDPEQLARDLHRKGTKAAYLPETQAIVEHIASQAAPGDVVCVLSSGAFDNLHDRILLAIGDAIRPARMTDMPAVRALLETVGLSRVGTDDNAANSYFVLVNETGYAGCVALDVLGQDAVLRSLAVLPEQRGRGYGWMLAESAVAQAGYRGVRRVYLLTETASDFFAAKFGFRVVERSTIGARVESSPLFSEMRDTRYVSMRLDLKEEARPSASSL